jgi:hypothetical protein
MENKNQVLSPGVKTDVKIDMGTSGSSPASETLSLEAAQQAIAAAWARSRSVKEFIPLEWGEPELRADGSTAIRCKFAITSWDKEERVIYHMMCFIDPTGKVECVHIEPFVTLKANADNESKEAESENRSLETAVDLAPGAFDIRLDEKRGTGYLVVSIQNSTDTPLPKHRLRFYRGDPEQGLDEVGQPHSGWHEAGPIDPGKTWNERTRGFVLPDGEYAFAVVLDYDQAVTETNEDNNAAALSVKIQNGRIVEKTNQSETENGVPNPRESVKEIDQLLAQWFEFCLNDQSVEASRLWHPEDSDGDIYKETRQVLSMESEWQFGGITEALFFEEDGMMKAVALSIGFSAADQAFGEKSAIVWDLAMPAGQSWKITQSSFVKLAKWEFSMREFYLQQHPQARVWKQSEPPTPEANSVPLSTANSVTE